MIYFIKRHIEHDNLEFVYNGISLYFAALIYNKVRVEKTELKSSEMTQLFWGAIIRLIVATEKGEFKMDLNELYCRFFELPVCNETDQLGRSILEYVYNLGETNEERAQYLIGLKCFCSLPIQPDLLMMEPTIGYWIFEQYTRALPASALRTMLRKYIEYNVFPDHHFLSLIRKILREPKCVDANVWIMTRYIQICEKRNICCDVHVTKRLLGSQVCRIGK